MGERLLSDLGQREICPEYLLSSSSTLYFFVSFVPFVQILLRFIFGREGRKENEETLNHERALDTA